MQSFHIVNSKEELDNVLDTVERKLHRDYEENPYINYKGETIKARPFGGVAYIDQPIEPVKQYKKVFSDTWEIAHLWAHQTQPEARTPRDNFYFEGKSIYSYGHHFEIARLIDVPNQENPVVIFNNYNYSSTTGGHQRAVRGAIPSDWFVFEWGNDPFDYMTNENGQSTYRNFVDHHLEQMERHREEIPRKQREYTYFYGIRQFKWHVNHIKLFIDIFQCKTALTSHQLSELERPVYDEFSEYVRVTKRVLSYKERMREKELAKRKADFKYYTERLPDFIQHIKELGDPVGHWKRTGERIAIGRQFRDDYNFWEDYPDQLYERAEVELPDLGMLRHFGSDAYVRWNEEREKFETSKSAYLTIDHVRRALAVYDRYKDEASEESTGEHDWVNINGRMDLGGFESVPSVNKYGDFKYGCHNILHTEVDNVREQLKKVLSLQSA